MHKLRLSLIVATITALLGFGWLLNQIYLYVDSKNSDSPDDIVAYENTLRDIGQVLHGMTDPDNFIKNWNVHSKMHLSLQDSDNFPLPDELQSSFNSGKVVALESEHDISIHYHYSDSKILSAQLPVKTRAVTLSNLDLILTLTFYAGVVLMVLLWMSPLIRHLIRLRNTAVEFGQGNLQARISLSRFSYIQQIEREFNRMADRIESLIQDNKMLSRAVSHDLKTPLARLRFGIDTLSETGNEKARQKYAQRLNDDLEEMEQLVSTLLEYARMDEGNIRLNFQTLDLAVLIKRLSIRDSSQQPRIYVDLKVKRARIQADKSYLSMLINNILHNAERFAKNHVAIRLLQKESDYLLQIEDDGPGIPEENRPHVLKPFWRSDDRTTHKGHGMGLAIAARIAEWHEIEIRVNQSQTLGGASFELVFQAADITERRA